MEVALAVQFDKEASQTRDYWVAKSATLCAARPDSSLRKKPFFGMTIKFHTTDLADSPHFVSDEARADPFPPSIENRTFAIAHDGHGSA